MEDKRDIRLSLRMTDGEMEAIENMRERLQRRAGIGVRVTQKTVIVQALELLAKRLDDLDRKR